MGAPRTKAKRSKRHGRGGRLLSGIQEADEEPEDWGEGLPLDDLDESSDSAEEAAPQWFKMASDGARNPYPNAGSSSFTIVSKGPRAYTIDNSNFAGNVSGAYNYVSNGVHQPVFLSPQGTALS